MFKQYARFETFTAMKIQVEVFWVVMLCGVVVRYQLFRGSWCLIFKQQGPLKCWHPTTTPHGITTQKTSTGI